MTPETLDALTGKLTTLRHNFEALEESKHAAATRTERPMNTTGRLGPQTPGRDKSVELCIDLELRLWEYVTDAKRYITPERMLPRNWQPLIAWLRFNTEALDVMGEDWLTELGHELDYQTRRIRDLIDPQPAKLNHAEPRQPARAIIAICSAHGYRITRENLRQLAHRGTINRTHARGRNLYTAGEVLDYLKENQ